MERSLHFAASAICDVITFLPVYHMNNHFALPGFDVPRHFLVGWMVCWWFLSSDGVMLRDANLFDKFASHFLEHFIFHTGIIQSLILVTCSVQDSLFTEANASTAPLSVFRLACHVIRVWKQLYMYMIWKAISGGTVLANFAKACDLGTSGGGFGCRGNVCHVREHYILL